MIKIKSYILAHKIISTIAIILLLGSAYGIYKKSTSTAGETRYITTKVKRGVIMVSVSATGQVAASNQIDLKPKGTGDVVYIGAKNGDAVSRGKLIARLDTTDAEKSVRDAEQNLESAKLSLEKLKIQNSAENLNADFEKVYEDGFNDVSNAFLDLPSIVNGLDDIFTQSSLSDNAARASGKTAEAYRYKAEVSYYKAQTTFEQNRRNYIALNNGSSTEEIEKIIAETYNTTKEISDAIKNTLDFANYMADDSNNSSAFTSAQNTLATYTDTTISHLSALTSAQTNIKNNKDSYQNADLDIRSSQLSVTQKENALQDAKDALADYFVRAPYDGIVTNITIKNGDQANSSTIITTLITKQQRAEVSMNEVDVAKIKVGEKANLTFDAIPDLTISGVVDEIDSIGTVSQGVVTYNVKILFDTQDERVKPSMSVSADIIAEIKSDVLIVPNSAIKSQSGTNYVEIFDPPLSTPTDGSIGFISKMTPKKIPVEVGLSNDSQSEIISGITEGEKIISRIILPSTTATTAPSLFGSTGNNRGVTGGTKIPTGR